MLTSRDVEIYGFNSAQLSAMFEAFLYNTPNLEAAKGLAELFLETEQAKRNEESREQMRQTRENMTDAEWSMIVD